MAANGIVRLCRNFVEALYLEVIEGSSETLVTPTTKFDGCGFLGGDTGVIIPSLQYANVQEFLDDDSMKPAFFKGYIYEISDDPVDARTCFNSSSYLTFGLPVIFSVFMINF